MATDVLARGQHRDLGVLRVNISKKCEEVDESLKTGWSCAHLTGEAAPIDGGETSGFK